LEVSHDYIMTKTSLSLQSVLSIGIKCAKVIGELHKNHIIHKDIKPHNILINMDTNDVRLIDFSISTRLTKEVQEIVNPDHLEGTLAYISPEQTGRMNRSIDYRTDFYSFGVTLYEMATGKRPFENRDPMELVHSHIAKIPTSPSEIKQEIPKVLSQIIMKLLSKNAEDRYKGAYGLIEDLTTCYNQLKESGKIEEFEIGIKDISDRFQIPEKLYGREKEITHLMEMFGKVADGSKEIIMFTGGSGIGKSALINEIHKPIVEKRGYFISGKYDQFKRNIPYTAVIQAFQGLVKQLITESEEKIAKWKESILKVVGTNGQVLVEVIPELELVIGKQVEVQVLPPQESQNRFNMVFQNFVRVFTTKDHPVVIFIDDLQWADSASLKLFEVILSDNELNYLLFLVAYRDNEVDAGHMLSGTFEKMKKEGFIWETINVTPLGEDSISTLLCESLYTEKVRVKELVNVVSSKTGGNPFFIQEFLKTLYDEDLIDFDNGWKWDIGKIQGAKITGNVVELISNKLQKLDIGLLTLLKIASCVGNKFDNGVLSRMVGKKREEIEEFMIKAVNEGMVLKVEENYQFVHDRVREAAYKLVEDKERVNYHYQIGMEILKSVKDDKELDEKVFIIVNQLNEAKELLNEDEKKRLIELNMMAGKKATKSLAYDAGVDFIRKGIAILPENIWKIDYKKALEYYNCWAEIEFLSKNYDEFDIISEVIYKNASNFYDKLNTYNIQLDLLHIRSDFKTERKLLENLLKEIGFFIPNENFVLFFIIKGLMRLDKELKKKPFKNLDKMIILKDNDKMAHLHRLLYRANMIYYFTGSLLSAYTNVQRPFLAIKDGYCEVDSHSIVAGALLFKILKKDYKISKYLAENAFIIADKLNIPFYSGKAYMFGSWFFPLKEALKYIEKSCELTVLSGDGLFICYAFFLQYFYKLSLSYNLNDLIKVINNQYEIVQKSKYENGVKWVENIRYFVLSLVESIDKRYDLDFFNKKFNLEGIILQNDYSSLACIYNIYLYNIIFMDNATVLELMEFVKIDKIINNGIPGTSVLDIYKFYASLFLIFKYETSTEKDRKYIIKYVNKTLKHYKPLNDFFSNEYDNKIFLLKAELARINNKNRESMILLYDKSIELAKKNGFTHEEAITNECAAKYYLSKGLIKIAQTYMIEARYCYQKWGAIAKVKQLEEKYPDFFTKLSAKETYDLSTTISTSTTRKETIKTPTSTDGSTSTSFLDINTVMKSTQALTGEIEMKKLLEKLIMVVIENAGAQKGYLTLYYNDKYLIEAEGDVDKEEIKVLRSIPIDESKDLSAAIVRYVAKTQKPIVLNDASNEGLFIKDEYISKNNSKSILCLPIIKQANLVGIIYLENNLTIGAFKEDKVELLKVLSTQIAISIENARLIENLKDQERLKKEMEIAQKIQTCLVPPIPTHKDLEITAIMRPAEEVGGDYYDIVSDKKGNIWFAIGDVSGHGVTPGLIMMMAETSFNTVVKSGVVSNPKDAIIEVNSILTENVRNRLKEGHFMTMSFLKYMGGGKFSYAGAHLDIVVWRAKNGKCELYKTEGLFLSIKEDIREITKNFELTLESGDIMVLYTDGIIEARQPGNRSNLWGMDNFCKSIESSASNGIEGVKNTVLKNALDWCGEKPDDDITMIVVRMK